MSARRSSCALSLIAVLVTVPIALGGTGHLDGIGSVLVFNADDLHFSECDAYDVISIENGSHFYREDLIGMPDLPVKHFQFVLPPGTRIDSLSFVPLRSDTLPGTWVPWSVQPRGDEEEQDVYPPDEGVYDSAYPYPANVSVVSVDGALRGFQLADLAIYPLQYIGAEQKLVFHSSIQVTATLGVMPADQSSLIRERKRIGRRFSRTGLEIEWIKKHAVNGEALWQIYGDPCVPT